MNNQFDELTKRIVQSITRRAALKKFGVGLATTALACFGLANHAQADPTFTTLDVPGAVFTAADDINAKGQISGWYIDTSGVFHGFLLDNAAYTSITFPGAIHTSVLGLNANGDVVGAYFLTDEKKDNFGYVLRNGTFTSIGVPGAVQTRAIGINANGDIVGIYTDQVHGKHHGFLLRAAYSPQLTSRGRRTPMFGRSTTPDRSPGATRPVAIPSSISSSSATASLPPLRIFLRPSKWLPLWFAVITAG